MEIYHNHSIKGSSMAPFDDWIHEKGISKCSHRFVEAKGLLKMFMQSCCICTKSIGINKCLQCTECKLQVHERCKAAAPLCITMINTTTAQKRKGAHEHTRFCLDDVCPDTRPQIPGQLVHCIVAIESFNMSAVGLYRVPGSISEVQKLFEEFYSNYPPKLQTKDPEVIASYVKKFLANLKEPLIPQSSYQEFIKAANDRNGQQLRAAIEDLPSPNLDTLAFLCLHWQKVATQSQENLMPLENLAKVLGPTVFCYHQPALNDQAETPTLKSAQVKEDQFRIFTNQKIEEMQKCDVLLALLNLDHGYWLSILEKPKTVHTSISTLNQARCSQPPNNQTSISHKTKNDKIKMQIDGIKLLIHCFNYSKKFTKK